LTVLTDQGKTTVIAKGARARRSRVTAAVQLLAYSELTLSESRGWQYLVEASTIELFEGVRQDIELLSLASYFAELTLAAAVEDAESGEILSLLLNSLYALGELKKPQDTVKAAFELKLMALAGFEPFADRCAVCGKREPDEPVLDVPNGIVRCRKCGRDVSVLPLTHGALAALRYVLYGDEKRLYSFRLMPDDQRCFSTAAESYVRAMMERDFHTLEFYRRLHPPGALPLDPTAF